MKKLNKYDTYFQGESHLGKIKNGEVVIVPDLTAMYSPEIKRWKNKVSKEYKKFHTATASKELDRINAYIHLTIKTIKISPKEMTEIIRNRRGTADIVIRSVGVVLGTTENTITVEYY